MFLQNKNTPKNQTQTFEISDKAIVHYKITNN